MAALQEDRPSNGTAYPIRDCGRSMIAYTASIVAARMRDVQTHAAAQLREGLLDHECVSGITVDVQHVNRVDRLAVHLSP